MATIAGARYGKAVRASGAAHEDDLLERDWQVMQHAEDERHAREEEQRREARMVNAPLCPLTKWVTRSEDWSDAGGWVASVHYPNLRGGEPFEMWDQRGALTCTCVERGERR